MSILPYVSSPGHKILIIFTIIACCVFFIFKWLKKKAKEYYKQEYWENRYSWYTQEMDWYTNFAKINKDFLIEEILKEKFPNKNNCKILEMGCGNSTMAFELSKLGYSDITSIDFSPTVITQMKEKYKLVPSLKYLCVDFYRLEQFFSSHEFDIIIEKAGLDSIAVRESPEVPKLLLNVYEKMHYVMKPNGIVLSVSSKNPTFWKKNALNTISDTKMFEIVQIKRNTFTTPNNPTIMNFYFYYLKRLEDLKKE